MNSFSENINPFYTEKYGQQVFDLLPIAYCHDYNMYLELSFKTLSLCSPTLEVSNSPLAPKNGVLWLLRGPYQNGCLTLRRFSLLFGYCKGIILFAILVEIGRYWEYNKFVVISIFDIIYG